MKLINEECLNLIMKVYFAVTCSMDQFEICAFEVSIDEIDSLEPETKLKMSEWNWK